MSFRKHLEHAQIQPGNVWATGLIKYRHNNSNILSCKSKGLSGESIKPPTTSNKMLSPSDDYVGTKARAKFNGDGLKQEKITLDSEKILNIWNRKKC